MHETPCFVVVFWKYISNKPDSDYNKTQVRIIVIYNTNTFGTNVLN